MKALYPLFAFNIIVIPLLVVLHFYGECKLISGVLTDAFPQACGYISNLGLNILYANAIMIVVVLIGSGKGVAGKTPSRPPSGSGSGGSSRSGSSDSPRPRH